MVISRLLLCSLVLTAAMAGVRLQAEGDQEPKSGTPLTLHDVVQLSQTGLSEDLIVTKIKKNGKAFDLSTEELLELQKAGVSDTIINYLLDP
jgi:hypothetical protein